MVFVVGDTVRAVPEVAERLPGVMTPVPLLKTGVSVRLDPRSIDELLGVKEVATGAATTVTVVDRDAVAPTLLVTVR